jgi:hypothetical protein
MRGGTGMAERPPSFSFFRPLNLLYGGILAGVLLIALSTGNAAHLGNAHAATAQATPTLAPTPTVPANLTPVPGDFSLYIDPTFGYSFLYPATWIVQPAINGDESDVAISAPYTPDPTHPMVLLIVRATTNYQHSFVQKLLCGADLTATKVGSFPASILDTDGGDPVNGYSAVALGRVFYAKGIAFEIWLQGSPHYADAVAAFEQREQPVYARILASFTPGPGAKSVAGC